MNSRKTLILGLFVMLALVLAACAGAAGDQGPAGPAGPAGPQGPKGDPGAAGMDAAVADLTCTECHDDSAMISGKRADWEGSVHGSGTATAYAGARTSCSGCHSGGGFSAAVAAGANVAGSQESADPNPSRPDCRACHAIHTTYTAADWALETTDPVALHAFEGETYDGGEGNLCVNCHQARRMIAEAVDGMIEITSTHWGPHHGPQSAMLMGLAGAGVEGSPSAHYSMVTDTCVACHLGEGDDHSFDPSVSACTACHADAEDFDINGVQTEVEAMLHELEEYLIGAGWLDEEGHPAVTSIPEGEANALWNWIYIAHEDKSLGVHNPSYTKALLEEALEAMK